MACACKANKELAYLHKKYGYKVKPTIREKANYYGVEGLKNIIASIIIFLSTPLLLLYVLYISFLTKERKISITKLFRFKKNSYKQ